MEMLVGLEVKPAHFSKYCRFWMRYAGSSSGGTGRNLTVGAICYVPLSWHSSCHLFYFRAFFSYLAGVNVARMGVLY